jgi:RNA polymerase sigma factor (sigma-70 family)
VETNGVMDAAIRDLQTLFDLGVLGALSDGQLLGRFVERREEAVFEAIMRRHGPMVWGVCRRVLRDHHDAEDAFQATFLVLARKSAAIVPREKLGNWLYGVAYQTAMKARSQRTKRRGREAQSSDMPEPIAPPHEPRAELAESLDRELSRLPEKYRISIVLCDLEGRNHREAADQLGWPVGTVSSRLSRARAMLAQRLSRRGVTLSAGSLAALLAQESASAGMPTRLSGHTVQAARLFAAGGAATAGMVPAQVAALTGEVMKVMLLSKIKIAAMALAASALVAGGTSLAYQTLAPSQGPAVLPAEVPNSPQELEPPPANEPPPVKLTAGQEHLDGLSVPFPTTGQALPSEDPLAELIMTGDHTPQQLERAKEVIESMIALEKEARGKSPEQLDEMIRTRAGALEKARWEIRVMDAQLRRLKVIQQSPPQPSLPVADELQALPAASSDR